MRTTSLAFCLISSVLMFLSGGPAQALDNNSTINQNSDPALPDWVNEEAGAAPVAPKEKAKPAAASKKTAPKPVALKKKTAPASAKVAPQRELTIAKQAQPSSRAQEPNRGPAATKVRPSGARTSGSDAAVQRQLADALAMVRNGQYGAAAPILFALSRRGDMQDERMQIKYILGVALSELKMYQTAAFQFVDVIRNGGSKYVRQSIERLSLAADALGDDTLLNYAVSKVRLDEFPENQKDVIYYRLGEIKQRNGQYGEAADLFSRVPASSRFAANARFNRGLALLENNKAAEALQLFQSIRRSRAGSSVTDVNRVASQMAIARTYYQMQDWEKALEAYREIPRDSESWHDALFESSWAELRAAKFRTTLSNLQSLHSPFYEDSYIPESLLVRAIVYLYICKFDETDKTLSLFDKTYGPVKSAIEGMLRTHRDPLTYYAEIEKAHAIRKDKKPDQGLRIPYMSARSILDQGNIRRSFHYLRALNEEKARIDSNPSVAKSSLGIYATKVLAGRFKNSKIATGEQVKVHLQHMLTELTDFSEQAGFIRYEMINGRKELLKKKIAGKEAPKQIDDKVDRVFYVQNGYEYWPFDGEAWLDEVGNYHYLGQQSCE